MIPLWQGRLPPIGRYGLSAGCQYRPIGSKRLGYSVGGACGVWLSARTNSTNARNGVRRSIEAQGPCRSVANVIDHIQRCCDFIECRHLPLEQTPACLGRRYTACAAVEQAHTQAQFSALAQLQQQGLIRHLGVSNVTAAQVKQAQGIAPIVCVQNFYNLSQRGDDALIDDLAAQGIAYVPFFPLGGFTPLQSDALSAVAKRLQATPMQVALAWLLQRSPNLLLIPGTSSVAHLHENLAAAKLLLPAEVLGELDGIGAV